MGICPIVFSSGEPVEETWASWAWFRLVGRTDGDKIKGDRTWVMLRPGWRAAAGICVTVGDAGGGATDAAAVVAGLLPVAAALPRGRFTAWLTSCCSCAICATACGESSWIVGMGFTLVSPAGAAIVVAVAGGGAPGAAGELEAVVITAPACWCCCTCCTTGLAAFNCTAVPPPAPCTPCTTWCAFCTTPAPLTLTPLGGVTVGVDTVVSDTGWTTLLATDELISLLIAAMVDACCCCCCTGVVGVVGVVGMFAWAAAAANMEVPPGTMVGTFTTLFMVSPRGNWVAIGFRLLLPCKVITGKNNIK